MAKPKKLDCSLEDAAIEEAKRRCGIDDVGFNGINLYCYNIMLPLEVGDEKAAEFANCVFHAVGVLDEDCDVGVGEGSDFCEILFVTRMRGATASSSTIIWLRRTTISTNTPSRHCARAKKTRMTMKHGCGNWRMT